MKTYTFGETILHIADNGKFYVMPKNTDFNSMPSGRANFEIKVCGERQLNLSDGDFVFSGMEETKSGVKLRYLKEEKFLEDRKSVV